MPLVRIFTRHPERTSALSSQLREVGYKVEVVSPDQAHLAPADLEIEFDVSERADVLNRGLSEEPQAEAALAPIVLQAAAQPAPQNTKEVPANMVTPEPAANPEKEAEASFAPVIEMPPPKPAPLPPVKMVEVPVMEYASLPPVAMIEDSVDHVMEAHAALVQQTRPAEPEPYLAQLTPFTYPTQPSSQEPAVGRVEKKPEAVAEGRAKTGTALNAITGALAGAGAFASLTASSVREQYLEYKKRGEVRSAEARAAREARLLDLEQRQAEAQQRAVELEAAREAAAARLVELVRQRDPGYHEETVSESLSEQSLNDRSQPEEQVIQAREYISAEEATALPPRRPVRRVTTEPMPTILRWPMKPQVRAVVTGAAAISALFIIGIVLGVFQSRSTPMASPSARSSTVAGAPNTGSTAKSAPGNAPALSDKQQPSHTSAPTATVAKNQIPPKPSPRVQTRLQTRGQQLRASSRDNADNEKDVVIRHFMRPVPTMKPKQSGQQAGLKHFSDLDN